MTSIRHMLPSFFDVKLNSPKITMQISASKYFVLLTQDNEKYNFLRIHSIQPNLQNFVRPYKLL